MTFFLLVGFNGFLLFFGVFLLWAFQFLIFWVFGFFILALFRSWAFTGSCFLFSSSLLLSRTLLRLLNLTIIVVVVVVVVVVVSIVVFAVCWRCGVLAL